MNAKVELLVRMSLGAAAGFGVYLFMWMFIAAICSTAPSVSGNEYSVGAWYGEWVRFLTASGAGAGALSFGRWKELP